MDVGGASRDATGVELAASPAANINHRATVFGGSAAAVAILAAWSCLHVALRGSGMATRLVIQRNTFDYLVRARSAGALISGGELCGARRT